MDPISRVLQGSRLSSVPGLTRLETKFSCPVSDLGTIQFNKYKPETLVCQRKKYDLKILRIYCYEIKKISSIFIKYLNYNLNHVNISFFQIY